MVSQLDSRKLGYILGAILFVVLGIIVGLIYQRNDLKPIEGITSLGTKAYQVAGEITGPVDKPILRPLALDTFRGELFIADSGNSRILVYGELGRFIRSIGDQGDSTEKLLFPTDLDIDNKGTVYVADRQAGRVLGYDQEGKVKVSFPKGKDRTTLGGFSPLALTMGEDKIFVFDADAQRLVTFSMEGVLEEVIAVSGWDLSFVNGLSYSKELGHLFLSNSNLGNVLSLDLETRKLNIVPNLPEAKAFLPRGNTLDNTGNHLFIVDLFQHKVLKYNLKDKKVTDSIGDQAQGVFSYPNDVSVNEKGWLFIADRANNRIVVLEPIDP